MSAYLEMYRKRRDAEKAERVRTTEKGQQIDAAASLLDLKRKEQQRLIQTLGYYEWLSARGIDWSEVRGVKAEKYAIAGKTSYNLLLVDGSEKIIHDPPYDEAVIFNRSYLPKDGDDQHDKAEIVESAGTI